MRFVHWLLRRLGYVKVSELAHPPLLPSATFPLPPGAFAESACRECEHRREPTVTRADYSPPAYETVEACLGLGHRELVWPDPTPQRRNGSANDKTWVWLTRADGAGYQRMALADTVRVGVGQPCGMPDGARPVLPPAWRQSPPMAQARSGVLSSPTQVLDLDDVEVLGETREIETVDLTELVVDSDPTRVD